jgi:hypothetical protein
MWKVTRNFVDDGHHTSGDFQQVAFDLSAHVPFRLLNEGGKIKLEGLITGDCFDGPMEWALEPLNDLGDVYGCTTIQFLDKGQWMEY